jgi:ribosomal protein L3 glutamine methyltransferase
MKTTQRPRKAQPAGASRGHRLRDLIHETIRALRKAKVSYGHGTTNARDEAAYLVLHALGLPLDTSEWDIAVAASDAEKVAALVKRRIRERKPAAYLTREAWLGEFRFYVDERVIVPRSYIAELLVDDLAPWIAQPRRVHTALDLCTGSGCLAILLAHSFPRAQVGAADVSRDALAVARRNVSDYALGKRIDLVRSDLYQGVEGRRYDLIVSNPPYVTEEAMRALPTEYRREPRIALAGGDDGLDLVRRIVHEAPDHLETHGWLVVEVGHARRRVERAFPRLPLLWAETSGGADCVFLISREALVEGLGQSPQATTRAASPRPSAAPRAGRASGAAAKRRSRNARASGGSR